MSSLPEPGEFALPERFTMPAIPIGTGEVCELGDPEQAADWSLRIGEVMRELARMKRLTDDALRDRLMAAGKTTLAFGDLEVSEDTGKPTYDAQGLYDGLVAGDGTHGLSPEAVESLFVFERKVADGKELVKLGNRNAVFARIVAENTKRTRGRLKIKRKRSSAPAPRVPEAFHRAVIDEARQTRESEELADDLGI